MNVSTYQNIRYINKNIPVGQASEISIKQHTRRLKVSLL